MESEEQATINAEINGHAENDQDGTVMSDVIAAAVEDQPSQPPPEPLVDYADYAEPGYATLEDIRSGANLEEIRNGANLEDISSVEVLEEGSDATLEDIRRESPVPTTNIDDLTSDPDDDIPIYAAVGVRLSPVPVTNLDDVQDLPSPPPTPRTPNPTVPPSTIPIEPEVQVHVADNLNVSTDNEDSAGLLVAAKTGEAEMIDEVDSARPRTNSQSAMSFKSATTERTGKSYSGLTTETGSFHYKTGWVDSTNVKVRKTLRRIFRPLRRQGSKTTSSVRSVDDYNQQRRESTDANDDVFFSEPSTPEKQHMMMNRWVLFRKKLNSELIRKLLDPRRAGRSEPTRIYTIDQGTSRFAIFNAKRDRISKHSCGLYLAPETYVSMGIPRVHLSSVEIKRKPLNSTSGPSSPDSVDGTREERAAMNRQLSHDSDNYSRDEFNRFSFRADMKPTGAVQTFGLKAKRLSSSDKEDEKKRSTESIQMAVEFT